MIESSQTPKKNRWVDIHATFPLFFRKYFFVFMIGQDLRNGSLEASDFATQQARKISSTQVVIFTFFLLSFLLLAGLFAFLALAYLVKMWTEIDLIPGRSPIPELLRYLRFCH